MTLFTSWLQAKFYFEAITSPDETNELSRNFFYFSDTFLRVSDLLLANVSEESDQCFNQALVKLWVPYKVRLLLNMALPRDLQWTRGGIMLSRSNYLI